jgi:hypothetical protein
VRTGSNMTWEFTGGLPETHCGYGSTLKATENLRLFLPGLLRMLNVRTLLDAPCGDFNWMRKVVLDDIAYIGMDVDEENLADAREWSSADFINRDVLTEPLPKADAWLCRDFLQHLPNSGVEKALKQFKSSSMGWFLATSFSNVWNQDIKKAGQFREVNLSAHPFCLPLPRISIADPLFGGRSLGVWRWGDF